VTIHGNMAELARLFRARLGSYLWLAARLENFALKRSAGVFSNSEYTDQLVKPRATRTWRVPNALRLDFFTPPQRAERTREATLLNVGVITPRKRQIQLLDLAEELNRRRLAFQFVFVGEVQPGDPYGARFLERIKPMETAGFARYLGTKEVDELVRLFDQSSALVHFPLEESFGLTVAEALARNLKLFGSRAGGLIDICRDAPGAELFDPRDWAGLAEAIAAWIGQGAPQPDGAGSLMRSRYHPEVIAARHLEIYREVLRLHA
jgi:glycosyltransferase involved in cell wall biosynthesis